MNLCEIAVGVARLASQGALQQVRLTLTGLELLQPER